MKLAITFAFAAMTLLAASTAPAADSILVSARPAGSWLSLDQKATNACFNAFLAQLLPGSSGLVRTVMAAGSTPVFTSIAKDPLLAPYKIIDVEMSAAKAPGGDLLAKAFRSVDRNAKVLQLDIHVADTAELADLRISSWR